MKTDKFRETNNYYTEIDHTEIYVDYTNKRVKIIHFKSISTQNLKKIIRFSLKQHLDKIICNCKSEFFKIFIEVGFDLEGKIDGYFQGTDAFCMSYFVTNSRKICSDFSEKELILKKCFNVKNTFLPLNNNCEYYIRNANENDVKEMVQLFSVVFSTYPTPIYDEKFLKQTMNEKVLYKVAVYNGKIIGIASADMDKENLNAEITDCATYSAYRGKGVLSNIIYSLELDLKQKGFITLYSLSRAINPSVNIVFSKHNYDFRGRLINNCNISGAFEDMNIWVKNISSNVEK